MTEPIYDAHALDFCNYCGDPATESRNTYAVCEYCATLESGECTE